MSSLLKLLVLVGVLLLGAALGRLSAPAGESADSMEDEHAGEMAPMDAVRVDRVTQAQLGLEFESVQMRNLTSTIAATAVVGADETRVSHIRPLTLGRVTAVHVRLGDRVASGQPLATYDNLEIGDLAGQLEAAVSAIESANAEAEAAESSLERARTLAEVGALPRAELERREAQYAVILASARAHAAEKRRVEEKLRRFGIEPGSGDLSSQVVLHAPFAGAVTEYEVAEGETIGPDEPLMALTDLDTVWVQANVYERDLQGVRPGGSASVRVPAYPDEVFDGRVTYVSDVLDPETRTAQVRIEVANPAHRLKLGMFANLRFSGEGQTEALAVPDAAVQTVGEESVAFVRAPDGRFEKRSLVLGLSTDGWVEVRRGLEPGETVVTRGSFALKSALLAGELSGGHD